MPEIAQDARQDSLMLSKRSSLLQFIAGKMGVAFLFTVTSLSLVAVMFIFFFIIRDAMPFFENESIKEFFTGLNWSPSHSPASFGALSIFYGSAMVTLGAVTVAVPLGICAAVCMSDILPFSARQIVKPIIEILASIPSVAYGFFALVVFAPALQENGGTILSSAVWIIGLPLGGLFTVVLADILSDTFAPDSGSWKIIIGLIILAPVLYAVYSLAMRFSTIEIISGVNILNASIILGIMALPTVVSVSEDALQAVGIELRQASYGLGATRAETLLKVVVPAASSGICAAVILGVMRAIGETMVVWMAAGGASQIPTPWYDITKPVRTLTATIAQDMGEADHVTGSSRYHVLFAMAMCLLVFCFVCNLASEWVIKRNRRKLKGA